MKKPMTHTAIMNGCDNRVPDAFRKAVKLRATKTHWVAEDGTKFRLHNGSEAVSWPMYRINLETLREIAA